MTLVAGVDTSTQSCKVLVVDAATGEVKRQGAAAHPEGTSVDPQAWWEAFRAASEQAGGLADVAAISVGGQQHGMVCLDAEGHVIRDALLWNDTRSADAARDLVDELGAQAWAAEVGVVPVAAFTVAKLRWLVDNEPENAARIAAVCLPHDWLTWRIRGTGRLDDLVTDRSDATGTGYFDPVTNTYRRDLLARGLRLHESDAERIILPRVLGPHEAAGHGAASLGLAHMVVGPGMGDNAGACLGLGLSLGQTSVSLGTSGVVCAVAGDQVCDPTGQVAGFADATGNFLPLACTLNAARVLDATRRILGVDHAEFERLAAAASPGSNGLTLVPWLEGERTPNLPTATGVWSGLTLASMTRENIARSAVEGMLNLMAACLDAVRALGVEVHEVTLIGGAARSQAVRALAPGVLGLPVKVPPTCEYVALGAARQAAWTLAGSDLPPAWPLTGTETFCAADQPELRTRYAAAASLAASAL